MIISVFGTNPPPGAYTLYPDAGGPIELAMEAKRYDAALVPDISEIVGGRVYLPSPPPAGATALRIMLHVGDLSLASAPNREVTVPLTGSGWYDGLFAESLTVPALGAGMKVSYDFVGANAYVHTPNFRPGLDAISPQANGLEIAAITASFRQPPGAETPANSPSVGYGIDILIDTDPTPDVPNIGPVANAGVDQTGLVGASVTLSGAGSTDADGTIINYAWVQVGGPTVALSGSGASRTFTPATAGLRTFRLTVTDDDGAIGQDTVIITTLTPDPDPEPIGSDETAADQLMAGLLLFLGCIASSIDDLCTYGMTIGESYVPFRPDEEEEDDEECEDDCNQLWLRVMEIVPQVPESWDNNCSVTKRLGLEIGVLRCFGIPEGGEPPRASELLAAANQSMQDANAIFCAAMNCDEVEDLWISIDAGTWIPLGPLGGQYGGFWTFEVEV